MRWSAALLFLVCPIAGAAVPHYLLRYDAAHESMSVRLCLAQAQPSVEFLADDDAPRYIDALSRTGGGKVEYDEDGWIARDWRAGECLDYRAALGRIADADGHRSGARHGRDLVAMPSLWLLRVDGAGDAEASVELPPGYAISAPWHAIGAGDAERRYRIPATPQDWLARVAIGRFAETRMPLPGGTLRISILDGADAAERTRLMEWLALVSRAAISAYGRLPLDDVQVLVIPVHGHEPVEFGQSTRGEGHALTLFVDPSRPVAEFDRDWVAVHELSHLFHPYLGDRGSWLAEGLATYYQNVLRARADMLTPDQAWEQLDAGFARGRSRMHTRFASTLEQASSAMDEQHDFMRIYWSGTAYWLDVDVELRRKSANRLSVDEALRRFDACCLPSERRWAPRDFVARLDALLGTHVFVPRFDEYRVRRDFPDLAPLYAELGIRSEGADLRFTDDAPASDVRRAIMNGAATRAPSR